jgi:lipoic acid synthetase
MTVPDKRDISEKGESAGVAVKRRPDWLKVRLPQGAVYERTRNTVRMWRLHTVCEEAICPNLGECWGHGTATIMVLGDACTRGCRFCAVKTGNPRGVVDGDEPARVGQAVAALRLKYVVLTSVDRDDLPDGGAAHFAECIGEIKCRAPETVVEVLIPDFRGDRGALATVHRAGPEVIGQNIETVRRLTRKVRDRRAGYDLTLEVLAFLKTLDPAPLTKSAIMVGLGETRDEVVDTLRDLRSVGTDFVTIGQYLQPTPRHLPVERFVATDEFREYEKAARGLGFKMVASAPFVRSSYRADLLAPFARSQPDGSGDRAKMKDEVPDGQGDNCVAAATQSKTDRVTDGENERCRQ